MTKGKFVVVEGSDASGKKTQVTLLLANLKERGVATRLLDFPTYESVFGELISKYLRGEFGPLDEIPPEIPSMFYALDRLQYKDSIIEDLEEGLFLVANRYCQSNWAYQGAKFQDPNTRKEFISWLQKLESRIPQPDLVFYLHTPESVAQKLLENREDKGYLKGEKMDIHESDRSYQVAVTHVYLELAHEADNWVVVECAGNGEMRSTEDINKEMMGILENKGLL
jgi:dTMP kinase